MSDDYGIRAGQRIRAARFVRGLTMRALADASGVWYRQLMDIENGRIRRPQADTLKKLPRRWAAALTT